MILKENNGGLNIFEIPSTIPSKKLLLCRQEYEILSPIHIKKANGRFFKISFLLSLDLSFDFKFIAQYLCFYAYLYLPFARS